MLPVPPLPVVYMWDFKVGVVSGLKTGNLLSLVVTLPDAGIRIAFDGHCDFALTSSTTAICYSFVRHFGMMNIACSVATRRQCLRANIGLFHD